MYKLRLLRYSITTAALSIVAPVLAEAQSPESADSKKSSLAMAEVRVEAMDLSTAGLGLDQSTDSANRLGLSLFEIPASVELIDQADLSVKGDFSGLVAVTRATGIASSASPGNGGTAISARGFNGHSSVMYTYDGVRLYIGAGTVSFPADTWTVDRVEVLRGPGSVTNGVGAIGATINYVPKKPNESEPEHKLAVTGGSNSLRRIAFGSGGAIDPNWSYRIDAVNHQTDGFVDRADEQRDAISGTLRYSLDDFSASFSVDYAKTDAAPYWGTPLVNGEIPDAIRENNYNVQDGLINYEDLWPRLQLSWQLTEDLQLRNDTFYMTVDRQWRNVESYDFDSASGHIDRSFYLEILHDQKQVGNRTELQWQFAGDDFNNSLSIGAEVNQIDFTHTNNSPYRGSTSVNLQNPRAGFWAEGVLNETLIDYSTDTTQFAIFVDNQYKFSEQWSVVAGLRYDEIDYTRNDFARDTGPDGEDFAEEIDNILSGESWRVGVVYQPSQNTSVYLQYSSAVDSIQSILTATNPTLDLAEGNQFEVGFKQALFDGQLQHALAIYTIEKKNLLSNDPGGVQRQIGQQSSQGVEWNVFWAPVEQLNVDFNVALISPEYDEFVSGASDFSGNTPRNVPERTANLWVNWLVNERASFGFGARYVGTRYLNNANSAELPSYTVWDASAQWKFSDSIGITARGKNLTDSTDYVLAPYGNQWVLSDGRAYEVSATFNF